jgi:hypothetical protein
MDFARELFEIEPFEIEEFNQYANPYVSSQKLLNEWLLKYAAGPNQTMSVKKLINAGAEVNTLDRNGNSPLMLAAQNDCVHTVAALLTLKDVLRNQTNALGDTAVILAAKFGHKDIFAMLSAKISEEDLNKKNLAGMTALNYASKPPIRLRSRAELPVKLSPRDEISALVQGLTGLVISTNVEPKPVTFSAPIQLIRRPTKNTTTETTRTPKLELEDKNRKAGDELESPFTKKIRCPRKIILRKIIRTPKTEVEQDRNRKAGDELARSTKKVRSK